MLVAVMPKRNLIPDLLKSRGWSIYRLARSIEPELSRNQVYTIANSEFIPDGTEFASLDLIAKSLGVKIDDLYIDEKI